MKRVLALAMLALSVCATTDAAAAAGRSVSISCAGTVVVVSSGDPATGKATAACHGTLAGTLDATGTGAEAPPCIAYSGHGSITGTSSTLRIKTAPNQKVCFTSPELPAVITAIGHVKVTGGTGTFAGATGTLAYRAKVNPSSGSVTVTLTGTLTS